MLRYVNQTYDQDIAIHVYSIHDVVHSWLASIYFGGCITHIDFTLLVFN